MAVSRESIRRRCLEFGEDAARGLHRRRPRTGDTRHLDEMVMLSAKSRAAVPPLEVIMSLRPEPIGEIPAETARVARAAFPKGTVVTRLRDEFSALYRDEDFRDLYPRQGQPALAP